MALNESGERLSFKEITKLGERIRKMCGPRENAAPEMVQAYVKLLIKDLDQDEMAALAIYLVTSSQSLVDPN